MAMPSSPPAKRAKAVEGASVPPSLHPLDASLEERRVLSGLPVVYTLLCDLCLPETKRADAAGSHDARRDDEPVVDLAQAMASKAPVEQRAAQALRMLARIKEDLTLRLVAILYACPRLPVQSGAALPLALVLSPRSVEHSSRVWSDVAKCGEGFLEKLESFWREWTTAVERTARDHPGDRSAALTAFRRRAARWPVLDFIARHVHTLRQGAPSYAFDTAFAATAEQVAEADVPMAQVLDELARFYADGRLSFPFKRQYLPLEKADAMMAALRAFRQETRASHDPHVPHNIRFMARAPDNALLLPLRFDGVKYLGFRHADADYLTMDVVVDVFQEEARLAARRQDAQGSPLELWRGGDAAVPRAVLAAALSKYGQLTPWELREAFYEHAAVKECTQFKPSLALAVLQRFGGQRVLDFSAGWGDRLAGAIAADVKRYVAFDPNTALRAGHAALVSRFVPSDHRARFSVSYEPFETAVLPPGETFNLIFTSPPFFDFEIYTQAPGQSVATYTSLEAWLVCFLLRCLSKAWSVLDQGGHTVIHLTDVYKTKVCEKMCLLMLWRLPGAYYRGVICSHGAAGRPRPLWVFYKAGPNASPPPHGAVGGQAVAQCAEGELRRLDPGVWEVAQAAIARGEL